MIDDVSFIVPRERVSGDPEVIASGLTRAERIFLVQRDDPMQVSTPYAKRHLHVTVFRGLIQKHLVTWRQIDSAYTQFLHDTFGDSTVSAYWVGLSPFGREVRAIMLRAQRARVEAHVREIVEQEWSAVSSASTLAASIHQVVLGMGVLCRRIEAPNVSAIYIDAEEADLYVSVHYDERGRATKITVRRCISTRRATTFTIRKG